MKRVLSVLTAVAIMLCAFSGGAIAAGLDAFNKAALPFEWIFKNGSSQAAVIANKTISLDVAAGSTQPIHLTLGASAFNLSGNDPFKDVTQTQMSKLGLYVADGKSSAFNSMFSYEFSLQENLGAIPSKSIFLKLIPKQLNTSAAQSFKIGLTYQASPNIGYVRTVDASLITLNATIAGIPPEGINGIVQSSPVPTLEPSMIIGEAYRLSLPDAQFTYSGATRVITQGELTKHGINVTSNMPQHFKSEIIQDSGRWYVSVTPLDSAPTGEYTGIELTLNGTGFNSVTFASFPKLNVVQKPIVQKPTATGNKINGIDPLASLGENANGIWSHVTKNGQPLTADETMSSLRINANDELTFEFDSNFFTWENGKPDPQVSVTSTMIRNGRISVRMLSGRNSNIIDSYKIKYDGARAYVSIKFIERFVSTKEKDFDFEIGLAYNGNVNRDTIATISGTIENAYIYVYNDYDYVDLSYGDIAYAEDSVRNIEAYLGQGITIHTRMLGGKKYYGTVSIEPDTGDLRRMYEYPEIDIAYTLNTVGLNSNGKIVKIDIPGRYYVYNRNLEYLGTTNERLPYSTKYYIASKELDTSANDPDHVVEVDSSKPESPSGSGSSPTPDYSTPQIPSGATPGYGNNAPTDIGANYNPHNGR